MLAQFFDRTSYGLYRNHLIIFFDHKQSSDMKVIINTINFYNNVIINHVHGNKIIINRDQISNNESCDGDLEDLTPNIIINEHPLVAQLKARVLQSEQENRELLDQLNSEKATQG
jgi:hypothetical protein